MTTTIQAAIPDRLLAQARLMVQDGWNRDLDGLLAEALRRYIDSHQEASAAAFVREDVRWGLHGQD